MENTTETQSQYDSTANILSITRKRERPFFHKSAEVNYIEDRLFFLKTQEIISELIQIMTFIKELEKFGFENTEVLDQIHCILSKLQSRERNYKYIRIVHVLTKYLSGIRDFTSTTNTKGIIFYKKLFESTLVAIMHELNTLNIEVY